MLQLISLDHANLIADLALTQDSILERVDEYSIYVYYLGYEPIPGRKYRSPIRPDDTDPSFNIFYVTNNAAPREFMWKDQATGVVGDIFRLVALMHEPKLTGRQAELKVASDFGLIDTKIRPTEKIKLVEAPKKTDVEIHVHSRQFTGDELRYWEKYNISKTLLAEYNVTAFNFYWLMQGQVVPFTASQYSFAYRINDRYKLYWPFASKDEKFRNNLKPDDVEGLAQLKYTTDTLVITKSLKDVMFLTSIGYNSVSPKSENTPIPGTILAQLKTRYNRVITLFDNDGKHKAAHYQENYEIPGYEIPLQYGFKDPTDLAAGVGIYEAKQILDELF